MLFPTLLLVLFMSLRSSFSLAFAPVLQRASSSRCIRLSSSNNLFSNEDDDDIFNNNDNNNNNDSKLGIDIGKLLEPLTPEQAEELRAEASQVISERVAQGVDDIATLRQQLSQELQQQSKQRLEKSERAAQEASQKLMNKIDALTNDFLQQSQAMSQSTKLAAAADQANQGKGVELGSWGSIGGASVTTGLLGSVASSVSVAEDMSLSESEESSTTTRVAPKENRILILADPSQDPLAKTLVAALSQTMQTSIPGVIVDVLKPTQTMPLGGNNAQCVVCFATSLSNASSLRNNLLDRLLRRTLQANGVMGSPPTQLVCVSTLGTERTNKVPYSLQNIMGGKLDKRRQVEEVIINTVQQRVTEPPLDYTIIKLGDLKEMSKDTTTFDLEPGDVLDGTTSPELAAALVTQAIAFQPFARNSTFSVVGNLPTAISDQVWNEAFVKLDGPELVRFTTNLGDVSYFDQLKEYLGEWALLMEQSSQRQLATPIRVAPSNIQPSDKKLIREGVHQRAGVKLLFLPTNTGSAYLSKAEERAREEQQQQSAKSRSAPRRTKPEGGVEVLVEVTTKETLRVRARRCNMADDTVLKEISEEKILKRLKESLEVWTKDIVS